MQQIIHCLNRLIFYAVLQNEEYGVISEHLVVNLCTDLRHGDEYHENVKPFGKVSFFASSD